MPSEEIRSDLRAAILCWCATVSADGEPNVSPKEIFAPHGEDSLVIADIASPITIRNIRANPQICVSAIDIFRQKGWKINGMARVIARQEAEFADLSRELSAMAGPHFPIRHVIHMRITRHARIIAPSYRFMPEMSAEQRMALVWDAYGVRPTGTTTNESPPADNNVS
ncbi:MAG: pyridoxamine 5'-phosphate oxidase family protein [Salinarimonas sp.]|nr:pyridoxamine 5'-phosphate oxidase family protein [Salinarimonas sp.]